MHCLLCESPSLNSIRHQDWSCVFYHCQRCDLIFREPFSFLSWAAQKARYDLHQNSPEDPQYVQYLQQFMDPLVIHLQERGLRRGLDWGSGPGPTLSGEMKKKGFEMQDFDPLYCPDKPSGPVDFITATEVIEHFQEPRKALEELLRWIPCGGLFAGMTGFHSGAPAFSQWWYARDPTHVSFFSDKTFAWLTVEFQLKVLLLRTPIFIFEKL